MSQSLSRVWLHLVFSTKNRKAYLQSETFRDEMFRMLNYEVAQTGCVALYTGGWIDLCTSCAECLERCRFPIWLSQ